MLQVCPSHLLDVATLPREKQKSHFQQYYSFIILIICYLRRKQTVIHLPTTLTCELQNFFIRLKVCCVLANVGGSEKSQLCVVVSGSGKNRL